MNGLPVRYEKDVWVDTGPVKLAAHLAIPRRALGVVLFAHGSGSSRLSPRNRFVAAALDRAGLGTLLMDLLTPEEEEEDAATGIYRFDVPLLAVRLVGATDWLGQHTAAPRRRIGYFGSSTGAAAALLAAVERPDAVSAVVTRGGRPDLAGSALPLLRSPTLFLVGAADAGVIELNRRAYDQLRCEKRLELVPDATHLFEEPGALEHVANLASDWFRVHFGDESAAAQRAA